MPVVPNRFSRDTSYRSQCADRMIEIVLDIENYIGVGRIFIPSYSPITLDTCMSMYPSGSKLHILRVDG